MVRAVGDAGGGDLPRHGIMTVRMVRAVEEFVKFFDRRQDLRRAHSENRVECERAKG